MEDIGELWAQFSVAMRDHRETERVDVDASAINSHIALLLADFLELSP